MPSESLDNLRLLTKRHATPEFMNEHRLNLGHPPTEMMISIRT